jgi:hypothetical protein
VGWVLAAIGYFNRWVLDYLFRPMEELGGS